MVRLNVIYTRTGDKGETGLGDGSRRPKFDPRVAAMGDVDETNSAIGMARLAVGDSIHAALTAIGEMTERRAEQPVRLSGRLRATMSFSQIEEIMASGAGGYVDSVRWQCAQAHTAIQQVYFDYSAESALVG